MAAALLAVEGTAVVVVASTSQEGPAEKCLVAVAASFVVEASFDAEAFVADLFVAEPFAVVAFAVESFVVADSFAAAEAFAVEAFVAAEPSFVAVASFAVEVAAASFAEEFVGPFVVEFAGLFAGAFAGESVPLASAVGFAASCLAVVACFVVTYGQAKNCLAN